MLIETHILDLIGLVLGSQTEQKSRSAAPWLAGPFIGAPELSPERIAVAVGVSANICMTSFRIPAAQSARRC